MIASGGPLAISSIPFIDLKAQYSRIEETVLAGIRGVLDHGRYVNGPEIEELEERLAELAGCGAAVGLSNGTDALVAALLALDVGPGDAVFVPSFTFTATAEVVLLLGARPVFVDVEEDSFNLCFSSLQEEIDRVREEGRSPLKAVIAVDLFGQPLDYPRLEALCEREHLALIADAAQSFGGSLAERRVGNLAAITTTSFFPAKPLGAYGDAGAILVRDGDRAEEIRSIREHGQGQERYEVVRVGINGRLDSIQAAVLLAKLTIFEEELGLREQIAQRYTELLSPHVRTPQVAPGRRSAWAQYTLQVDGRDAIRAALAEEGIPTAIYYPKPMHLQTAYASWGRGPGSLPVSEGLSQRVLSLPFHPYLEEAQIEKIAAATRRAAEQLTVSA